MPFELVNPQGLERPIGYAHVAKVSEGRSFTSPARHLLMNMVKLWVRAILSSSSLQ
jgi:hypothetical protein